MNYYKIIQNDKVIDVIMDPTFVRQSRRGLIITCLPSEACGVVSSDGKLIWHITGKEIMTGREFSNVSVVDITEDEYKELYTLLELGADIPTDGDVSFEETEPDEVEIPEDTVLSEAKIRYVEKMSAVCQKVIYNGIDVEMSDGSVRHFTLEIEDQLNLITLSSMIAAGETMIPYHASDELCVFYSAEDISRIISTATAFKTYQTSYFNSLKNWIMSVESINAMGQISYGDIIPEEYRSDVLNELMTQVT